jgi:hypothetical protein
VVLGLLPSGRLDVWQWYLENLIEGLQATIVICCIINGALADFCKWLLLVVVVAEEENG